MSELPAYRDNLADILAFIGGRRMLNMKEVMEYTGIRHYETVRSRFPFQDRYISAPTLARCLAGGGKP